MLRGVGAAQDRDFTAKDIGIPAIARIAGVRVGADTLGAMKRRLGPGVPFDSGRGLQWAWPAAECSIRTTFEPTTQDTDVLRAVALECRPRTPRGFRATEPIVHGYVRELGWMGKIAIGAKRDRVSALTRRLPKPEEHGGELIFRAARAVQPDAGRPTDRASAPQPMSRWAAVLRFTDNILVSVRVAAQ